jgi:hypothetical protein
MANGARVYAGRAKGSGSQLYSNSVRFEAVS